MMLHGGRVRFLSVLILLLFGVAFANASEKSKAKIVTDTSKVKVRSFDKKAIEQYKSDSDFNYEGNGAAIRPSLWQRFWAWLWRKLGTGTENISYLGAIIEYTLLAVFTGLLIFLILKALGINVTRLWRGQPEQIDLKFSESLENIHQIDFDTEIEKAVSQHNYRLAVRLLYLKCLKQLSDARLINWQIDKTNWAYLQELTKTEQKQNFGVLTRQFEYVWYGDFPIDQDAYGNISDLFQDFKKRMP